MKRKVIITIMIIAMITIITIIGTTETIAYAETEQNENTQEFVIYETYEVTFTEANSYTIEDITRIPVGNQIITKVYGYQVLPKQNITWNVPAKMQTVSMYGGEWIGLIDSVFIENETMNNFYNLPIKTYRKDITVLNEGNINTGYEMTVKAWGGNGGQEILDYIESWDYYQYVKIRFNNDLKASKIIEVGVYTRAETYQYTEDPISKVKIQCMDENTIINGINGNTISLLNGLQTGIPIYRSGNETINQLNNMWIIDGEMHINKDIPLDAHTYLGIINITTRLDSLVEDMEDIIPNASIKKRRDPLNDLIIYENINEAQEFAGIRYNSIIFSVYTNDNNRIEVSYAIIATTYEIANSLNQLLLVENIYYPNHNYVVLQIDTTSSEIYIGQGEQKGYAYGYQAGLEAGDEAGFNRGYNAGYLDGETVGQESGYQTGYNTGHTVGYNEGLAMGTVTYTDTFKDLITAVVDVPVSAFIGLFNFELLGYNMSVFITALLSIIAILAIIRIVRRLI